MTRFLLRAAVLAAATAASAGATAVQAADDSNCKRKVVAKGFPNRTETVASLSAVRLWVEATRRKYGPDYSMWHNAASPAVRCNLVDDYSGYRMCIAIGRPCPMHPAMRAGASAATLQR